MFFFHLKDTSSKNFHLDFIQQNIKKNASQIQILNLSITFLPESLLALCLVIKLERQEEIKLIVLLPMEHGLASQASGPHILFLTSALPLEDHLLWSPRSVLSTL